MKFFEKNKQSEKEMLSQRLEKLKEEKSAEPINIPAPETTETEVELAPQLTQEERLALEEKLSIKTKHLNDLQKWTHHYTLEDIELEKRIAAEIKEIKQKLGKSKAG